MRSQGILAEHKQSVGVIRRFSEHPRVGYRQAVLFLLQVISSPVALTICVLLFGVSIIALAIGVVRRRSARNWAIVAVACVVLVATFGGILDNVHGGGGIYSSGRGGGGEDANRTPSDNGLAHPSPKPSLHPWDKKADFVQSYEEADGYLRAARLNVPLHEAPAEAVAACRTITFVRKTETPQALVEYQVDAIYDEMGRAN